MEQFKVKVKNHFTNYNWKVKAKIITIAVIVFLIVFDQVMKLLVRQYLPLDVEKPFLPGFINWRYTINHGSAFGLNQGKTILLMTFAFIVAFGLLVWWFFSRTTSHMVGISFLLAGTIGNLIDRFLFAGGVIDFLKWDMFNPKTIFNVADIFVTIGIIIIVIAFIVEWIQSSIYNRREQIARDQEIKNQKLKALENGSTNEKPRKAI